MAQPHMTGCRTPQTPTPVEIRYPINEKHIVIVTKLIPKAIHHHPGVLPSMTPAMRSETQPTDRCRATKGVRSNSAGGACTRNAGLAVWAGADVATSAISGLLSLPGVHPRWNPPLARLGPLRA